MRAIQASVLPNSRRTLYNPLKSTYRTYANGAPAQRGYRASAKLFADAANEETELAEQAARANKLEALRSKHENWTGDESMQDAVLRMLVDKYKPMRGGPIRTADEKLKKAPPRVEPVDPAVLHSYGSPEASEQAVVQTSWGASSNRSLADVPLLPAVEGHQPWHTTFTIPSHARSSVKYGNIPSSSATSRLPPNPELLDEKARRKLRENKKRTEQAGRLQSARESTLDYRLGIKAGAKVAHDSVRPRANPTGMKGWASLVEDRIERARQEGRFDKIEGRGQPLKQFVEERNPFIGREEFLLNRLVQRQGAAPPWVDIQQELESALKSFRDVLRQSWTRRAIRMLTLEQPASLLSNITVEKILTFRDTEWEARERAYHSAALEEVNSLVRKFNGMAPYAVRRGHYALEVELERIYKDSAEDILSGIAERVRAGTAGRRRSSRAAWDDENRGSAQSAGDTSWSPMRLRDFLRDWLASFMKR
ncbi:uncharacterized protein PHACADRAFT_115422 [Phanerochaete carnosa HHB-10118-sp]|uniref:DnaJ homologue subfamily C member 28 conserved domain-containing protein n=1 Tax=Phanerochaete carnosa (strain HHB-10118-sp) TaxID=650164 RepID=K5WLE8_PHACS|nr:uncharacterized protein PHACADRAFT_115422 [Phanerochaete carnosa HHB-10118-sp]EKM60009.1 hypothetical protein PHACADRAFT_115422 [Phanerochaete carnosa HHB-10118-sp]